MGQKTARAGLYTARALVSAVLESGDWHKYGIENWTNGYAEPGYHDPELGILFGDWNNETRYDKETQTRVEVSDRHSRFSAIAEHAGYGIEWYDEWSTCGDCGKAVRTSADSYSWQPAYVILNECELVCHECLDWADYLQRIEDDPRAACTADCDPAQYGYVRLSDSKEYENGFHPGQTDDPSTILKACHARGIERVIFRIPETSQFYIRFETWYRPADPDSTE